MHNYQDQTPDNNNANLFVQPSPAPNDTVATASNSRGRSTMSRNSTSTATSNNGSTINTTTTTTTTSTAMNHGLHHRRIARSTSNDDDRNYISSTHHQQHLLAINTATSTIDDQEQGNMSYTTASNNTLQQRYNAKQRNHRQQQQQQQQQHQQQYGGSRRQQHINYSHQHHNHPHHGNHNNSNRILFGQWARTCVLAGIPAYLVLLVLYLHRMNVLQSQYTKDEPGSNMLGPHHQYQQHSMLQGSNTKKQYVNPQHYYSVDTPYIKQLYQVSKNERKLRYQYDIQEHNLIVSQQITNQEQKTKQRRSRTQVPSSIVSQLLSEQQRSVLPKTQILSVMDYERPISKEYTALYDKIRPGLLKPASVDEICGIHAKKVVEEDAIEIPDVIAKSYTSRDSLQMPKTRTPRVLITGILNPIGYMLAIALKQSCDIDVVIGFDSMYPNSISNRLRLQQQIAVLTKYIPKLVRPIFIAHIGLDPIRHGKMFRTLHETGEMNIVALTAPTHIVHFASYDDASTYRYHQDVEWKNHQHPNVRDRPVGRLNNMDSEDNKPVVEHYNTAMYGLRNGLLSMEQILASIASAPVNDRPHFIYASSSSIGQQSQQPFWKYENVMHIVGRQMDEILADYYYQQHGITSIGLRLPNTIYGPYNHPESNIYQVIDRSIRNLSHANTTLSLVTDSNPLDVLFKNALVHPDNDHLDLLHVNDVVDATIAAMQYRKPDGKPELFDIRSGNMISLRSIQDAVNNILDPSSTSEDGIVTKTDETSSNQFVSNRNKLQQALYWKPSISLHEGLVRTVAWHMDRIHPYGPPLHPSFNITPSYIVESGDSIKQRHKVVTCTPNDYLCHGDQPYLPCASECATQQQCVPTVFDELVPMVNDLTEACDIVLLTHNFDIDASDLTLQAEYVEGAKPQICNFAFVRGETKLVNNVIHKVPDSELSRLGVEISPDDTPESIQAQKLDRLNGRLLYRGWILIWTNRTPETLSKAEKFLLKLAPGKLFHPDVKYAVFIDQGFGVSPRADDVLFLVHEMNREPWKARIIKRKNRPKAKFLIPSEPQRKAVILMSELKYQDSSQAERLAPQEKISTYEATRFMRYSIGEEPLGKEPPEVKLQREFYDRVRASINPDHARGPSPLHKFELNHWVRSRWVAHDMVHEESRQLRCDWYKEHVFWESDLDQLSFAYVMQRMELSRKLAHNELDETAQKQIQERTEMKKLLSDTFEWHALQLPQNKLYSPYEEMQILPFDMDNTEERELLHEVAEVREDGPDMPLYVRIISDRIMAYARKSWSNSKGTNQLDLPKHEL